MLSSLGLDEAGEIAHDDTKAVADLLHLNLHLVRVLNLAQGRDDLAHVGQLAHDGEHLLLHVLGDRAEGAALCLLAVVHQVDNGILEVAYLNVLIDLSELADESEHVLADIFNISDGLENLVDVLLGLGIEALSGGVGVLLVEAVVVAFVEALNTLDGHVGVGHLESGGGKDGGSDKLEHF